MGIPGMVEDGVVIFAEGLSLPDGTEVLVIPTTEPTGTERNPTTSDTRTIGQKLADLAREVEKIPCDLPEDLALNHDHYLYGRPKRQ